MCLKLWYLWDVKEAQFNDVEKTSTFDDFEKIFQ
jgi:hypothetical protein